MATPPSVKQLIVEDLKDAGAWINKLVTPLNSFMRSVTDAFNKRITITENMDAEILTFTASGSEVKLAWGRSQKPTVGWIGNIERVDGSAVSLTAAVTPVWTFSQDNKIVIKDLAGLDDSTSKTYKITMIFMVK
jgi:hypothetical protein